VTIRMNIFLTTILQCKTKNISNGPHDDDKYKQNKHEIQKLIYGLMFSDDRILNLCAFIYDMYFFVVLFFVCGCLFVYNIFTHVISYTIITFRWVEFVY